MVGDGWFLRHGGQEGFLSKNKEPIMQQSKEEAASG